MAKLKRKLALAAALQMPVWVQAAVPPGSSAEILDLQGKGEQRQDARDAWTAAQIRQALAAGAFVRTATASKMALLFADQTQIRLHENSVLQIKGVATPAQPTTTLTLSVGRAWMQSKRTSDSRLNLESPAATAAIRGTDWELDVDPAGKTMLTVLSGTVDFFNAQGSVTVAKNEAAIAEVGKAPVKILLSNPRDRVQWVNALTADPLRHIRSADLPARLAPARDALAKGDLARAESALANAPERSWPAILLAAGRILSGDLNGARTQLNGLLAQESDVPSAAYLLLSDIGMVTGDMDGAAAVLQKGLQRSPGNADLLSQLARVQLLSDRVEESERTLAQAREADNINLQLARGELARRKGDAAGTLDAYAQAKRLAPDDDRGWFGLGSAHTEREDTTPARDNLTKALELNPRGAGYRGELGMLDTFINRFADAEKTLADALSQNPSDYLALTAQGLLRLKQGQPDAALDAFLRAGVMEPRYARAKTYTAVAYYQLGRRQDAISTLLQASELDDKDPVPYMLLSQIYTDLSRPGDAVQASRDAVKRLPYLKSLNQLANDQKGSANLGSSLAYFGLEDWALEIAQQSDYPYWGGSHLFLADRYAGEFNKNSKLFQGFLTDPLAFGASNRFSTLLQRPGNYGAADMVYDKEFARLATPSLTVNGLNNSVVPVAYFLQHQRAIGHQMPIPVGAPDFPKMVMDGDAFDVRANVTTAGLGTRMTDNLGLFVYHNDFDAKLRGRNNLFAVEGDGLTSTADYTTRQNAVGVSYRWSPTSQTWLMAGSAKERMLFSNLPTLFVQNGLVGLLGLAGAPDKKFNDIQLRHTADISASTRISVGLEHVKESQYNEVAAEGVIAGTFPEDPDTLFEDLMAFGGSNRIDRRFSALTLSAQHALSKQVAFDGALVFNRAREKVDGSTRILTLLTEVDETIAESKDETRNRFTPRVGMTLHPNDNVVVRAAYQDWLRPSSVGTLNNVETAGIPVEDRLVQAGGRMKRSVAQVGWTANDRTFLTLKADHARINNPGTLGVDLRTPSLPFLEQLRNAQTLNLSTVDVLEESPDFERGTLRSFAAGINRVFRQDWSGYLKYHHQHTSSSYDSNDEPSGQVTGKRIPFVPRHTFVVGTTWAGPNNLYLSGRMVYRSERFEEQQNLTALPASWSGDLLAMWESPEKRWMVGFAALNLFGKKSPRQTERYTIDVRYRF